MLEAQEQAQSESKVDLLQAPNPEPKLRSLVAVLQQFQAENQLLALKRKREESLQWEAPLLEELQVKRRRSQVVQMLPLLALRIRSKARLKRWFYKRNKKN